MPSSVITRKSRFAVALGASTKPVKLTISYGYAQIGGSALHRAPGSIPEKGEEFDLGKADKLVGTSILVKSVVADISDATNKVNVLYSFAWGTETKEISAEDVEVENDGDPALFITRFDFLKNL